jgi:hypothetical protein
MNNRMNNYNHNNNQQTMRNMNTYQVPKQEIQIENDSGKIDELAGEIYQIIEKKYPK